MTGRCAARPSTHDVAAISFKNTSSSLVQRGRRRRVDSGNGLSKWRGINTCRTSAEFCEQTVV